MDHIFWILISAMCSSREIFEGFDRAFKAGNELFRWLKIAINLVIFGNFQDERVQSNDVST